MAGIPDKTRRRAADDPAPALSVMDLHVLLNGRMRDSGEALAAAVFELAQAGYLDIHSDFAGSQVRLVRTAKSGADLPERQRETLAAIFTELDAPARELHLDEPAQWPVAPAVMAKTRASLIADGYLSPVKPRTIIQRILIGVAVLAGITLFVVGVIVGDAAAALGAGGAVGVFGANIVIIVSCLEKNRSRQVIRTRLGNAVTREARRRRRSGPALFNGSDPPIALLHDLLWLTNAGADHHPGGRAARPRPPWWHGPWPDDIAPRNRLRPAFHILRRAFTPVPGDLAALQANRHAEAKPEIDPTLRDLVARIAEGEASGSLDFTDWGGGGGDGGGGGGGGDGGGGDGGGGG